MADGVQEEVLSLAALCSVWASVRNAFLRVLGVTRCACRFDEGGRGMVRFRGLACNRARAVHGTNSSRMQRVPQGFRS